jgi:DNA repair protein RadC
MGACLEPVLPLRSWSERDLLACLLGARGAGLELADCVGREPEELDRGTGLGRRQAERLAVALELGRRALCRPWPPGLVLRGGQAVHEHLAPRLLGERVECFWGLYLDAKGMLVHEQELSRGTLTASLVHPREVLQPAVVHRAAAVVVAHNHPSGDPRPSTEDRATTRRLQQAARLLGIELLDHVVLGAGSYRSFLEEGWLEAPTRAGLQSATSST